MDRRELQDRARFLASDELQYAIAREEAGFDTEVVREKATIRFAREAGDSEIYELCRATIDSIWRGVERQYVVDLNDGQLKIEGVIRTDNRTLLSMKKAREADWIAFDALRQAKLEEHSAKREVEHDFIYNEILPRLRAHGGDPTTAEACADLIEGAQAA